MTTLPPEIAASLLIAWLILCAGISLVCRVMDRR